MTKEKVIESIEELYNDLDKCVTDLLRARSEKDTDGERKALFTMESLMVACQQELSFLHDYLNTTSTSLLIDLDEAANEFIGHPYEMDEGYAVSAKREAFQAGASYQYQKDRVEFAKLKAQIWQDGFKDGAERMKSQMQQSKKKK